MLSYWVRQGLDSWLKQFLIHAGRLWIFQDEARSVVWIDYLQQC